MNTRDKNRIEWVMTLVGRKTKGRKGGGCMGGEGGNDY